MPPVEGPRFAIPGLVATAVGLCILSIALTAVSWLNFPLWGIDRGADFDTTPHFFTRGAPWDIDIYFNFLAYALLTACTVLGAIANLRVASRAPKLFTIYVSLFGLAFTFIVWLHLLVSKASDSIADRFVSIGAGAWVAMLGFACFLVAGLLAP